MVDGGVILMRNDKIVVGPYQFAIDITNQCNYRCLHCYNASGENNACNTELTDEELESVMEEICAMKPQNICFCGGEPLLRAELVYKLANYAYTAGVGSVSMVSNGFFLDYEVARKLKKSHVRSVQISLDGANTESCFKLRRNDQAYDKAIAAIKNLSAVGYNNIDVAFIPNKANKNELEEVVELCASLGVREVRCQPLMLIGRGAKNKDEIVLDSQEYIEFMRKFYKIKEKYFNIKLDWGDPVDHLIRFRASCMNGFSPTMMIKADGSIIVSPYLPLSVGNVRKHRIHDYWESGYNKIWSSKIVQDMASSVVSIDDMQNNNFGKKTWLDEDISLDLIDNSDAFKWTS